MAGGGGTLSLCDTGTPGRSPPKGAAGGGGMGAGTGGGGGTLSEARTGTPGGAGTLDRRGGGGGTLERRGGGGGTLERRGGGGTLDGRCEPPGSVRRGGATGGGNSWAAAWT